MMIDKTANYLQDIELLKNIELIAEKATYNNLAQVGTWLQEIIKVMKE